jgi:hypothetical protein
VFQLSPLVFPKCRQHITPIEWIGKRPTATRFQDCLRRCDPCGIGASNTADPRVTYIHRDPLENIPVESREHAIEALSQALNVRNRVSKLSRFGFSTSEDAVTWVVFTYLLRSGRLLKALKRSGLISNVTLTAAPTLLLWGTPIESDPRGSEIHRLLIELCTNLKEDANSFSEPDVIIDLGEDGLVFIEVKYLSGNDLKSAEYPGWSKYERSPQLSWQFEDIKASGCYELARNWCLLKSLAAGRPATLANLGPASLFLGKEGARLDRFVASLGSDDSSHFVKLTWPDLIGKLDKVPDWFDRFCRDRRLI